MRVELHFELDSEYAKKLIRYAELLERVQKEKYPDAKRIDEELTTMLDSEDRRTPREIFLKKSESFTVHNCANNVNAQDPEWIKNNPDHCYCKNLDSINCYDCECWEQKEEV